MLVPLVWFGGVALVAGALTGFAAHRSGVKLRWVFVAGLVGFAIYNLASVWWASRSCGSGCVRDATALILVGPLQLLAFLVGAVAAYRLAQPAQERGWRG